MRTALTIAGSDSIGGAGIQADVKAMSVLGVHAATVITAVTAQNTCGVDDILPIPGEFIKEQLEAVLKDADIKAIKTGMLYSAEVVGIVADILEDHEAPLIVDPVMVAGTGSSLMQGDLVHALKRKLLPICELVTPNKPEAEALAGIKIKSKDDERYAAEVIGKEGSAVLMKGGHFNTATTVTDMLYLSADFTMIEYPKLDKAGHGSGCVLSSYITAHMAKGLDVANAVFKSRAMIQEAIATQYAIGHGDKIVDPVVAEGKADVFQVLDSVDALANRIIDIVPEELVPKGGMNIAMAVEGAAGPEQIAAIDKRLVVHNGLLRKGGSAKFGVAEGLSYILLAVMEKHPEIRCIMSLACTKDLLDVFEEVGMTVVFADLSMDKLTESTESAISKLKTAPDAIADKGSKKNRVVRILARDAEDMLSKLESIL